MSGNTSTAADGVRVLIVEDEILIADLLEDILSETDFKVVGTAGTGPKALEVAERTAPQLALVDINLKGGMDGVEVAARLRERHGALFVFVTGSNDPATRNRAAALDPAGFLNKPFTPSNLRTLLETLFPKPASS